MKVLVTGSHGLIGSDVVTRLTGAGHYVVRLVRSNPDRERGDVIWDPVTGNIERARLKDIEAVVHLAGENLLGLWTRAKKERIHKSRVVATEYLAEALSGMSPRPKVFVSASAIGYYGNRGDEWLTESSPVGSGFLPRLCREWEEAANIARNAGIRVVHPRTGLVLTPRGGMLGSMLGPFKMGLGGPIGRGRQYMSWITLDDLVDAILFLIENETLSGPVNMVSPQPVTNREFTKTLASVLRRPAFLPVPTPILKLLPGNMAEETMLSSARVEPAKLIRSGFKFKNPDLEIALQQLIG